MFRTHGESSPSFSIEFQRESEHSTVVFSEISFSPFKNIMYGNKYSYPYNKPSQDDFMFIADL
jgi:hypothetical protein